MKKLFSISSLPEFLRPAERKPFSPAELFVSAGRTLFYADADVSQEIIQKDLDFLASIDGEKIFALVHISVFPKLNVSEQCICRQFSDKLCRKELAGIFGEMKRFSFDKTVVRPTRQTALLKRITSASRSARIICFHSRNFISPVSVRLPDESSQLSDYFGKS